MGCNAKIALDDGQLVDQFIKEVKRPIVISTKRGSYPDTSRRNVTFLSADNQVLLLESALISLPDTIK